MSSTTGAGFDALLFHHKWIIRLSSASKRLIDVPLEILDKIIDYFARDKDSLLSCSLVCHAFLPRSQHHLFSCITIPFDRTDDTPYLYNHTQFRSKMTALCDLLKHSPHIATHIQQLKLILDVGLYALLAENIAIFSIMTSLSQVACVKSTYKITVSIIDNAELVDEDKHVQRFDTRVWQPLIAPFITHLSLHKLQNIPVGMIANCSLLVNLSLQKVTLAPINANSYAALTSTPPTISRLTFFDCTEALNILFNLSGTRDQKPFIGLSDLYSFHCYPTDVEVDPQVRPFLDCFVATLGRSMETLQVYVLTDGPGFPPLSDIPSLRFLEMRLVFEFFYETNPMSSACMFLRTTSKSSALERVKLFIMGLTPQNLVKTDWTPLDVTIKDMYKTMGVDRLELIVNIEFSPYDRVDEELRELEEWMGKRSLELGDVDKGLYVVHKYYRYRAHGDALMFSE